MGRDGTLTLECALFFAIGVNTKGSTSQDF
jgi:hypothetical protein